MGISSFFGLGRADIKAQLAQTAKKDEVFSMANMGQDVREAMTGGSVAVVGTNGVLTETIVEKQITPNKTSFFNKNYNLFDLTKITSGYLVNNTTGSLDVSASYVASDFIPVIPGTHLYQKTNLSGAFYDTNKNYVSGKAFGTTEFTVPNGCYYYRVTILGSAYATYYVSNVNRYIPYSQNEFAITDNDLLGYLNQSYKKLFTGKKWAILGDSWSEVNSTATTKYHDLIVQETGITIQNLAVSGSGYKRTEDSSTAFYQKALSISSDTDVVTIFGSGNDCGSAQAYTFGTYTDTGTTTLAGCINTTIDNIIATAPNAKILLIAPAPWINFNPYYDSSRMGLLTDVILSIGKRKGIKVLDLYHESGLRPWDATFKGTYFNSDGVHPNDEGHKKYLYPPIKSLLIAQLSNL